MVNDPSLVEAIPPNGPVTFSVSGDEVVIDNELPRRAQLVIYRNGQKVRTLRSPGGCCLDLWVQGNRYWTLGINVNDRVFAGEYVLNKGADRLTNVSRTKLPKDTAHLPADSPDDEVSWDYGRLQRTDTGLFAVPLSGPAVLLEGTGPAPTDPPYRNNRKTVIVEDPGFTAKIHTRHKGTSVRLMSRSGGCVFYEVNDGVGPNWGYIYQFTTTGTLVHTYTLHEGFIQTGNRIVVISDDGQVYQLVVTTKTARVLHIPPN